MREKLSVKVAAFCKIAWMSEHTIHMEVVPLAVISNSKCKLMRGRAVQLSLVQKKEKDGRVGKSYRYEFWHVQGRDLDGRRIRKKFSTREEALNWKSRKEIELVNRGQKLHSVITDLSEEQIKEAQACFLRLGDRYRLTECIDFFLQHFHEPNFKISLSEASVKFRGALEGQVRERSACS
jgi:hypothetical protein